MRVIILCILFLCCTSANQAVAYVVGGSNFSAFNDYPKPSCFLSPYATDIDVQIYVDCINKYVKNANNDIERIREAAKDAVLEAKIKLHVLSY